MFNPTSIRDGGGRGNSAVQQQSTNQFPMLNNGDQQSQTAQFLSNITASSNPSFGFTSSPITNNYSQQQHDTAQFAPSFLFGNQQPTNRRSFATPTRHILTGYGNSPGILKSRESLNSGSGNNKNVHWSPVLVRERSKSPADGRKMQRLNPSANGNAGKTAASTLWSGPPLRSLNEDILGPPAEKQSRLEISDPLNIVTTSSIGNQSSDPEIMILDEEHNKNMGNSTIEEADSDNTHWITVFGFAPERREDILEMFSRHGDIMAYRSPKQADGISNWVHIRYSSPVHVKQALAKNATVVHGQMIGVVPCKDRHTLEDREASQRTTPIIPQPSPANQSQFMNGSFSSSKQLLEQDNSLLLNGSRLIPSTSAYKAATPTTNSNTSLPSRARLSISSRAGMRPLNSSFIPTSPNSHDDNHQHQQSHHSMESSFNRKSGGIDDSFIGKIWNIFTGNNDTQTTSPGNGSNSNY